MKIINLPSAREDLADGFAFYESRNKGLEVTFSNHSSPILIHFACMEAYIERFWGITDSCPIDFHTPRTIPLKTILFLFGPF